MEKKQIIHQKQTLKKHLIYKMSFDWMVNLSHCIFIIR